MSAELLRACACGCGQPAPLAKETNTRRGHVKGEPIHFIKGHNARFWTARPAEDRFWEKVDKSGDCWIWTAGRTNQGYGRFSPARSESARAHRYSYELAYGPIAPGLVIDHLCRNKACVRPDHLEPVTTTENIRRAHPAVVTNRCKHGHEFTAENTRHRRDGSRACRTCERTRRRESHVQ